MATTYSPTAPVVGDDVTLSSQLETVDGETTRYTDAEHVRYVLESVPPDSALTTGILVDSIEAGGKAASGMLATGVGSMTVNVTGVGSSLTLGSGTHTINGSSGVDIIHAGSGSDTFHHVGGADRLFVVLDHNQGIAKIT